MGGGLSIGRSQRYKNSAAFSRKYFAKRSKAAGNSIIIIIPNKYKLYAIGENSGPLLPRPRRRSNDAAGTSDLRNCALKPVVVY